jgi:hypothetical protein
MSSLPQVDNKTVASNHSMYICLLRATQRTAPQTVALRVHWSGFATPSCVEAASSIPALAAPRNLPDPGCKAIRDILAL